MIFFFLTCFFRISNPLRPRYCCFPPQSDCRPCPGLVLWNFPPAFLTSVTCPPPPPRPHPPLPPRPPTPPPAPPLDRTPPPYPPCAAPQQPFDFLRIHLPPLLLPLLFLGLLESFRTVFSPHCPPVDLVSFCVFLRLSWFCLLILS